MPTAPARPCPAFGCSELVIGGRCPSHGTARQRANAQRGGSGSAWQEIRRRIFDRDGGFCVLCRMRLTIGTAEIDHIRRLDQGGGNEDANLRTLCRPCHLQVTNGGGGS